MKLAWAFPTLAGGKVPPAVAKPAKGPKPVAPAPKTAPAALAKLKPAPKPPAAPPQRSLASLKGAGAGANTAKPAAATPKPAKPTKDILTAGPHDKDYSLIGYGNPPRHPQTGQELAPHGPGRAPELFHKNGEITGKPLWRYEGAEHWQSNPTSALHAWMAVFATYFPAEAKMLGVEYRKLMEEEERAAKKEAAKTAEALLD